MDQVKTIVDPIEAGKRWAQIDREIRAQVPVFPTIYFRSKADLRPGDRRSNLRQHLRRDLPQLPLRQILTPAQNLRKGEPR